jgi:hypothetical protein
MTVRRQTGNSPSMATPQLHFFDASVSELKPAPKRQRLLALDFFRGLAMLIIFVAHVPNNPWDRWIPARFGFSSSAELFVFSSGLASAFAFGSIFVRCGFAIGLWRIGYRIWQVYWAHIGLFLAIATLSAVATWHLHTRNYVNDLNFDLFEQKPLVAVVKMMTLTYIPDLLNILPMYLVLLALVPVMMALAQWSRFLLCAVSIGLWAIVQITHFDLPGGVTDDWVWFFNPFAWQLLFFTGFCFGMGYLPQPPFDHRVFFPLAAILVIACIPVAFWGFIENIPILQSAHDWLVPDAGLATTELHALRYFHFLVLSYVVLSCIARVRGSIRGPWFAPIVTVGQQSLATFVASLALAWIMGMVLDVVGRNLVSVALANVSGLCSIFAIAYTVRWFKAKPWEAPAYRLVPARHGTTLRLVEEVPSEQQSTK